MAEKKKSRKKDKDIPIEVEEKPTKEEYAVAKYLKNNTPTKKTKFLSHQVNYFYANKLVDVALDSPWATGKDVIFTDRKSVVDYCDRLLKFKFFHRAKKIAITDKDLRPKDLKKKKLKEKEEKKKEEKKEKEDKKEKEKKSLESKKEKEKEKEDQNDKDAKEKEDENIDEDDDGDKHEEDTDKNQETEEKEVVKKEKKKKKTKIKLDMHLEQIFVDGTDAYVWMYDPIPFWYYIVGGLCLFGAIAVCLFPLWPPEVRKGVYYLSVAAAGFLGVILGLAVIRFIVFCIIWILTMGRHHLWLLPNLTEDVGFFQSFWPLYHYEYRGDDYKDKKKRKKKKSKEEKEEEEEEEDKKSEWEDQGAIDSPDTAAETDKPESDAERGGTEATGVSESESENSNSQAFEIVEKEDLVEAQEAEAEKEKEKEEQTNTDNDEATDSKEKKEEGKVEE